jgi:hypothetical protein
MIAGRQTTPSVLRPIRSPSFNNQRHAFRCYTAINIEPNRSGPIIVRTGRFLQSRKKQALMAERQ